MLANSLDRRIETYDAVGLFPSLASTSIWPEPRAVRWPPILSLSSGGVRDLRAGFVRHLND